MPTLYNQYIYRDGAWRQTGTSSDSVTYTISYSNDTLTLRGSDGSTSSVAISGGGDENVFVAEYNVTSNFDILTAYNAGKAIFTIRDGYGVFSLGDYSATSGSNTHQFNFYHPSTGINLEGVTCYLDGNSTSTWSTISSSGTLGRITSSGDITTSGVTIASGDRFVINDESASQLNNSSITFGTSSTKYLANNGTWQNVPSVPVTSVNSKIGDVSLTASDVGALPDNTSIPSATSDLTNDSDFVSDANYVHTDNNFTTTLKNKLDGISSGAEVNVQADWSVTDTSSDAYIKNKPDIPDSTSDLTNDSNFVSDASYVHTDNNFTTTLKNKLDGISSGAEVNVQANWNETNISSDAYIQNKPDIPDSTSDLTNDSNFVSDASYVHTDNNFTTTLKNKLDGISEGATVDDHKWNDVSLTKSSASPTGTNIYLPYLSSTSGTSASLITVVQGQSTAYAIPRYDANQYIYSVTPPSSDNSTKVATTAFVKTAVGSVQPSITASGILKGNGSGTITAAVAGTDYQAPYSIVTATISSSGWSNSVYSALQTTYPSASYDIEIELNGDSVTDSQKTAWDNAQIVGSATSNTIKALGDVPTVDIPVIVKATPK